MNETITLVTLNLNRKYGDWPVRQESIAEYFFGNIPDALVLQEVTGESIDVATDWNQALELATRIGFKKCVFDSLENITRERGTEVKEPYALGLACLTKGPIKRGDLVALRTYPGNGDHHLKANQILFARVSGIEIPIINVHFSNNDTSAKRQLQETLTYCRKEGIRPIIAGDFNMKVASDVTEIANREYEISVRHTPYTSFPPSRFSSTKVDETLDYILVHKEMGKIVRIACGPTGLSDHKPVFAEIELAKKH